MPFPPAGAGPPSSTATGSVEVRVVDEVNTSAPMRMAAAVRNQARVFTQSSRALEGAGNQSGGYDIHHSPPGIHYFSKQRENSQGGALTRGALGSNLPAVKHLSDLASALVAQAPRQQASNVLSFLVNRARASGGALQRASTRYLRERPRARENQTPAERLQCLRHSFARLATPTTMMVAPARISITMA